MGKYANHNEFAGNAPPSWREETTSEVFLKGMSQIAPPGMKPKTSRAKRFEEKTDRGASTRWHHNYDIAMFGGTDIPLPSSETKQMTLEELYKFPER